MGLEDKQNFKRLIKNVQFLENLSSKIHHIKKEEKIYRFICSEFRKTK